METKDYIILGLVFTVAFIVSNLTVDYLQEAKVKKMMEEAAAAQAPVNQ